MISTEYKRNQNIIAKKQEQNNGAKAQRCRGAKAEMCRGAEAQMRKSQNRQSRAEVSKINTCRSAGETRSYVESAKARGARGECSHANVNYSAQLASVYRHMLERLKCTVT